MLQVSNSAHLKKVEHSNFGIDKPDALCNLCLRPFNFTIIFRDNKQDENKVIGNACIYVNSPAQHCLMPSYIQKT